MYPLLVRPERKCQSTGVAADHHDDGGVAEREATQPRRRPHLVRVQVLRRTSAERLPYRPRRGRRDDVTTQYGVGLEAPRLAHCNRVQPRERGATRTGYPVHAPYAERLRRVELTRARRAERDPPRREARRVLDHAVEQPLNAPAPRGEVGRENE